METNDLRSTNAKGDTVSATQLTKICLEPALQLIDRRVICLREKAINANSILDLIVN